jgi:hypothetical protein
LKKLIVFSVLFVLPLLTFTSCESEVASQITIKNIADARVMVNFRANLYEISPDRTRVLKDIPQGTYQFNTTFELPAAAMIGSEGNELSGNLEIQPGTRITILYSSTFIEGEYTLYANITTSANQSPDDDPFLP